MWFLVTAPGFYAAFYTDSDNNPTDSFPTSDSVGKLLLRLHKLSFWDNLQSFHKHLYSTPFGYWMFLIHILGKFKLRSGFPAAFHRLVLSREARPAEDFTGCQDAAQR